MNFSDVHKIIWRSITEDDRQRILRAILDAANANKVVPLWNMDVSKPDLNVVLTRDWYMGADLKEHEFIEAMNEMRGAWIAVSSAFIAGIEATQHSQLKNDD
jgi:hypothetical protein